MGRKFGKFGVFPVIRQTKTIENCSYVNNPLTVLFIHQTFFGQTLEKSKFAQILEKSKFAKHSPRQTFPLYGIKFAYIAIIGTLSNDYLLYNIIFVFNINSSKFISS